jgi:hypothetical protein
LSAIDTLTNTVIATVPIGQAPQAVNYVPGAVPDGAIGTGAARLGIAGRVSKLVLVVPGAPRRPREKAPTIVSLYDQGLTQVLEAAVTGLEPNAPYLVALSDHTDGSGALQPLATFTTNRSGAAIVNAVGPIRQIVRTRGNLNRRYVVIVPGKAEHFGAPVQVEVP